MRSTEPLQRLPARAHRQARALGREAPDRIFVARATRGRRRRLASRSAMREMLERARPSARRWSTAACRPSGRSRSCPTTTSSTCTLALGALWAGVPFVPVSPAYSLVSQDYGKLRHIVGTLTPGLVSQRARPTQRRSTAVVGARRRGGARRRRRSPAARATPFDDAARHRPRARRRRRARAASGPTRSPSSSSPRVRPRSPRASSTPTA